MTVRALVLSPDPNDTVSIYRLGGPLSLLRLQIPDFVYAFGNEISWNSLAQVDVCLFNRPFNEDHIKVLKRIQDEGKPLWVDYDDLLVAVPDHNPASQTYNKPEVLEALKVLPSMADILTVTTKFLGDTLRNSGCKDVRVIPNAWWDNLLPTEQASHNTNKSLRIVWRGSASHVQDLDLYSEAVMRLHKEHPEIHWFFLGYRPWFTRQMDVAHCHVYEKPLDYVDYIKFLAVIAPDIGVVPLTDCPFNKSKSNIAWMEFCYAGAVTIAPDMDEWHRPGVVNYKDSVYATLSSTIENLETYKPDVKEGWNYILDNLLLSKVNYLRWEVLKDLLSKKKPITTTFLPLGNGTIG